MTEELKAKLREILRRHLNLPQEEWRLLISQINQTYEQAGYVPSDEPFRSAAMSAMQNMIDELPEMMSGQEFYDRFENKLPRLKKIITKEYNDGYADAVMAALAAARKAGGLEQ